MSIASNHGDFFPGSVGPLGRLLVADSAVDLSLGRRVGELVAGTSPPLDRVSIREPSPKIKGLGSSVSPADGRESVVELLGSGFILTTGRSGMADGCNAPPGGLCVSRTREFSIALSRSSRRSVVA
jgi:hypothetical protein